MNGSIWTLIYEWRLYLLVAVLVLTGVFTLARPVLLILAALAWGIDLVAIGNPTFTAHLSGWLADPYVIPFATVFLCGAVLCVYRDRIPDSSRLGLGALLVVVATLRYGGFYAFGLPALAYLMVWVSGHVPQPLDRIGRRNDYSYGVYVWGFGVQQGLAHAGVQRFGYLAYLSASFAGTLVLAWLSWHVIEKHALRLKDRWPVADVPRPKWVRRRAPAAAAPARRTTAKHPVSARAPEPEPALVTD